MAQEFALDLFETLAFRLGETRGKKRESGGADDGVYPECAVAPERTVEQRERICERERAGPEGESACRHGHGPDAVGEYFGEEHPRDGAEGHGIAGDSGNHEYDHHESGHVKVIARAQCGVDQGEASGSGKHQALAAQAIDRVNGCNCEYHVCDACKHDIEEHFAEVVSGIGKYFLCVIEYHVGAAPLLEYGYYHAYGEQSPEGTAEEGTDA